MNKKLPTRTSGGAYHWREYNIEDYLPSAENCREVLLLGCGDAGEINFLQQLGYKTAAFDIVRSSGTDFLADAHRLPLHNETFDMVLSMQVLEHLHSPWVAVGEIARVLRPGGWFIGSVAFLKPYHNSYFHMTHKGIISLLGAYGLQVDKFAGAQSLIYTIFGQWVPLGSRSASRFLYSTFEKLLFSLRGRLWSLRTQMDPYQPTSRFDPNAHLSFYDFEKLRFAPAVVFRAKKLKP